MFDFLEQGDPVPRFPVIHVLNPFFKTLQLVPNRQQQTFQSPGVLFPEYSSLFGQDLAGKVLKIFLHLLPGLFKQLLPFPGNGFAFPQSSFQIDVFPFQSVVVTVQGNAFFGQSSDFVFEAAVIFYCLFHAQGKQ